MGLDPAAARADQSVVEAAHVPWQPLGRILVDKGLLSEGELERALDHQAGTGRRLGETLVELGFVSRTALTRALAAQYGLELATEKGFGTGLRAELERRHDPELDWEPAPPPEHEPAPVDALALLPTPEPSAYEAPELARLEEQWAMLAAADQRLAEAEHELAALRERERRRRAQARRLVERVRGLNERLAELQRAADRPATRVAPTAHLVLVQLPGRYELVEREGPPPETSSPLELPELGEGVWLVAGSGRSPLPHDDRPCVLAQPLPPPRAPRQPPAGSTSSTPA